MLSSVHYITIADALGVLGAEVIGFEKDLVAAGMYIPKFMNFQPCLMNL